MRIYNPAGRALTALVALAMLGGCSGGNGSPPLIP